MERDDVDVVSDTGEDIERGRARQRARQQARRLRARSKREEPDGSVSPTDSSNEPYSLERIVEEARNTWGKFTTEERAAMEADHQQRRGELTQMYARAKARGINENINGFAFGGDWERKEYLEGLEKVYYARTGQQPPPSEVFKYVSPTYWWVPAVLAAIGLVGWIAGGPTNGPVVGGAFLFLALIVAVVLLKAAEL